MEGKKEKSRTFYVQKPTAEKRIELSVKHNP